MSEIKVPISASGTSVVCQSVGTVPTVLAVTVICMNSDLVENRPHSNYLAHRIALEISIRAAAKLDCAEFDVTECLSAR